jgi:glycosyltransferase involved in cell wall biosynthesis
LPEIIGDAGLLVPPGEPKAVGSAVRTLLDDPLLCRTLGDRARARVLDRYTWPTTARRLMELTAPLVESTPSVR